MTGKLSDRLQELADGVGDCAQVARELRGESWFGTGSLVAELPALIELARTTEAAQADAAQGDVTQADLADEIAEAISDTLGMDWSPSWAAPNILAIINRERAQARKAALEEAAKVAERWLDPIMATQHENDTYRFIAKALRALGQGEG